MALDPELAAIFKAESDEHMKILRDGFLALESDPTQPGVLDEMFRAAHRFKGAARVLGFSGVEAITHHLEDLLEALRSGRRSLNTAQHDRLSTFLCGMDDVLVLALRSGDEGPQTQELLAILDACLDPEEGAPDTPEQAPPEPVEIPRSRAPHPTDALSARPLVLEALRVPTQKLDELLNLAGELLVSHQRLKRRAEEAEGLSEQMEELFHREKRPGPGWEKAQGAAATLAQGLQEDEARLDSLLGALEDAVRRTRLVPLSHLFDQIPRWVRDLARQTRKEVDLSISGGGIEVDKRIIEGLKDPLIHVLRNAVDHGLESPEERRERNKPERGHLEVRAEGGGDHVHIWIEDDGRGVDAEEIRQRLVESGRMEAPQADALGREALFRQLFTSGFSTRRNVNELSGRGVGLDLVRTQMEEFKGSVSLDTVSGQGTRIGLRLPLSLATTRVLLVEAQGMRLGIPAAAVQRCLQVEANQRFPLEGRECFLLEGNPVLLLPLGRLLGAPPLEGKQSESQLAVVLQHLGERIGVGVDALLGEQEVLQKPLGPRLRQLTQLSGAAMLGDGGICLVLNPAEVAMGAQGLRATANRPPEVIAAPTTKPRLLLVDDSITTRIQLRRILEAANFDVTLAVDGLDAWTKLSAEAFDALVSDVEMPGMDGFTLTERVRAAETTARLPVVLVTALAQPEQQRRGLDAGANAYITKGRFDQEELIETLQRLT